MNILNALQTHLIGAGVVRKPAVAGAAPPLFIEPRLGVPAPGEGQSTGVDPNLVLGAFLTGGMAGDSYELWRVRQIIDVQIRTRQATLAVAVEAAMTKVLADRRDWTMGGQYILESLQWRALQRLGSDEQGYQFTTAYLFETLRP